MNGWIKTIIAVVCVLVPVIGAAFVLKNDVGRLNKTTEAQETRLQECEKVDERRNEQYKHLSEKMDAMLLQVNALQKLMQNQIVQQETMKIQIDMIKENVDAVKTQVTEALRTY